MLRRLRQDATRLRGYQASKFGYRPIAWFLDPSWLCVCLYRLSHLMWSNGYRNIGRFFMQANSMLTGADIQPGSDLGGGLLIPSPSGVTLSAKAGDNLLALALAGFGGSVRDTDIGAGIGQPVVGDDVTANQFTGIQGSIRLGDRVVIDFGAGAVVDVADDVRMVLAVEPHDGAQPACPKRRLSPALVCGHRAWRVTRDAFDQDVDRYRDEMTKYAPPGSRQPGRLSAVLTNSVLALWTYRVSHWLFLNNRRWLALKLCQSNILVHKLTIPPASCLGGGVLMPHLAGTLFSGAAGRNLTLYANSLCMSAGNALTLSEGEEPLLADQGQEPLLADQGQEPLLADEGQEPLLADEGQEPLLADEGQEPLLADEVSIGGHSGVFGPVEVGARVQLGPKVQLDRDVPNDTQVWSSMARGTNRPREIVQPATKDQDAVASPFFRLPPEGPWRETLRRLERDRSRLRASAGGAARPAFYPAFACVGLFRLSHYCLFVGSPRLARWLWMANVYLTGADISPRSQIGGGLLMPHPAGIALDCRSGSDLTLLATSGIAASLTAEARLRRLEDCPRLGDGVLLSQHSGIYGPVTVGDGARITPGCIVTRSVAPGVTLVPRALKFRGPAAAGRRMPRSAVRRPLQPVDESQT